MYTFCCKVARIIFKLCTLISSSLVVAQQINQSIDRWIDGSMDRWIMRIGSSATSGDFLEVSPGTDTKIIVDLYFKLPPSWDKYTIDITNINVLMNSRGPKFADQRRIMKVRLGKSWITIGNNSPNGEEMWAYQSMAVPTQTDMYAYFNKNGVLRLRLQSNNNFDSFDMDYIVLEIQNLSDETSPPTASPTAAPVDNGGGVTTSIRKLGECQGSCSTSFNDCAMGLSCWTNQDLTQPIPGCSNQNGRVPGANYCYNPQ